VDLSKRGALRRVFAALVERHEASAGLALDANALLRVGWPGERVLAAAGATRVRVAIASLRRLGLGPFLLTYDEGYLLDPRARISRESD